MLLPPELYAAAATFVQVGFSGYEGQLAPGTVAPLRDGYIPVGELDAVSGAEAESRPYTVRQRPRNM